jgi:RHS repeat-associated protein
MELQENELGTFDFHARMYDPQIGRSFQPDPHADSYAGMSPFSFLGNNPISITDLTGMDIFGDGFGSGSGSSSFSHEDWYSTGSWMETHSLRGAGGFLAAFNPRGQYLAEKARYERSRVVYWVEKYKDWYEGSEYTGMHYKNTTFQGRELRLYSVEERFPNGELLYGVNFWQPSSSSWTSGPPWSSEIDPKKSDAMNKIYSSGLIFMINMDGLPPSNPMYQRADVTYDKRNFLGNNVPMTLSEAGSFVNNFDELIEKNRLNPNFTYFRFIEKLDFNSRPVYRYGVIPSLLGTPQ